jgi:hypothetical protein
VGLDTWVLSFHLDESQSDIFDWGLPVGMKTQLPSLGWRITGPSPRDRKCQERVGSELWFGYFSPNPLFLRG